MLYVFFGDEVFAGANASEVFANAAVATSQEEGFLEGLAKRMSRLGLRIDPKEDPEVVLKQLNEKGLVRVVTKDEMERVFRLVNELAKREFKGDLFNALDWFKRFFRLSGWEVHWLEERARKKEV